MKGSVARCSGVSLALHLLYSLPWMPSRVIWLGQVRFRPVGLNAPWKSISKWFSAAVLAISSYQLTAHWSSRSIKSIFSPAMPHFAYMGKSLL